MLLDISSDATIQSDSYEDYLYKLILLLQQYEQDVTLNPHNISNVNSSENHDDNRFESQITISCNLLLTGIDSFFYLPISTLFTNGTETDKDLLNLNLFQSLFTVISALASKEVELAGSGSNRFNWSVERNAERSQNNAVFNADVSLDLESHLINYNGQTVKVSTAKELYV